MDFLIPRAKKVFVHLERAFFKTLIFRHFDLEYHIYIKIDISRHVIGRVLSQITLDQYSSDFVTHKHPISSKFEIG